MYDLIITHFNERTLEKTASESAKMGFNVHLVNDGPFWKTFIAAFKLASQFKAEWFVKMDADQFLLKNAEDDIRKIIAQAPKETWRISGVAYDFLWQCKRKSSPGVYNTEYIKDPGVKLLKKLNKSIKRPERFFASEMEECGYKFVVYENFEIANHDFEQYYRDIYRKGYQQADKLQSLKYLKIILKNKNKSIDHDIFIRGVEDFFYKRRTDIYKEFNITEKPPL
jgi:hypothetical protein